MILRGRPMVSPTIPSPNFTKNQNKKAYTSSAFSFAKSGAKEKAIKKKSAEKKCRALRSATVAADGSRKPLKRLDLNFN